MTAPRVVSTGMTGLDVTLGGGLWLLERLGGHGESATILVRGSAGTGKSLLAIHLAAALADNKPLSSDIAYGCIELLPAELEAQVVAFDRTKDFAPIVTQPFEAYSPVAGKHRLFAATIDPLATVDNGDAGQDPGRTGYGLMDFLHDLDACGAVPRVLVIDSLSNGYRMGQHVDRRLADAVAKLAVDRGMIAILVEEASSSEPSPWCFSVDTVIELALNTQRNVGGQSERTLSVTKHRFGRCEPGPHQLSIGQGSAGIGIVDVFPAPEAWARALTFASSLLPTQTQARRALGWRPATRNVPMFSLPNDHPIIYVVGRGGWSPVEWAVSAYGDPDNAGITVLISLLTRVDLEYLGFKPDRVVHWPVTEPWITPAELAAGVVARCRDARPVNQIVVGDLAQIKEFASPDALRRSLVGISEVVSRHRIPVILFETGISEAPGFPGATLLVEPVNNHEPLNAIVSIPSRSQVHYVTRRELRQAK